MAVSDPSIVVSGLDVTYRIYRDKQRNLRRLLTRGERARYRSIEAVRNVSFVARPGEIVGVVGHNGSGKSTLLRAMAGLLPPTTGTVFSRSMPILLGVGAALEKDVSGRRNVYLGATAMGMSRAAIDERVDDVLDFAGVTDFADMPLRAYSSGMKARLQFAIATAVTPDILMVDEALAVGDEDFKERSEARINQMMEAAGTIFLVTHGAGTIKRMCTRALLLDHGALVADGDPAEVIKEYRQRRKRNRTAA